MIEINGRQIDPQHYIDKWTNWALEATPATDEQVIRNVQRLYEKSGLEKPEVKVFRDYDEFTSVDWASVGDSVSDSIRDSIRYSIVDSVSYSVGDSVRVRVRNIVRVSVKNIVSASTRDSVVTCVGAWYWADELAFADVFADAKLIPPELVVKLHEYKQLLETQRLGVLCPDAAYILVAPTIRRNDDGQLHSDQRPAVEWKNSTGQYYLDGVNLPKDLWARSERLAK